jgi:hypothetical protein
VVIERLDLECGSGDESDSVGKVFERKIAMEFAIDDGPIGQRGQLSIQFI